MNANENSSAQICMHNSRLYGISLVTGSNPQKLLIALLLTAFVAGCGGNLGGDPAGGGYGMAASNAPSVIATAPADSDTNVMINTDVTATFNRDMDSTTINTTTFTVLDEDAAVLVPGVVSYAGTIATFHPNSDLTANGNYTAKITAAVMSLDGYAIASDFTWRFSTQP